MRGARVYESVRRTNARARALVSHYGSDPVYSSRVYCLNAVARALVLHDLDLDEDPDAIRLVTLANLLVLEETFPGDPLVAAELRRESGLPTRLSTRLDTVRSYLHARRSDGSLRELPSPDLERGPLSWKSIENRPPVRPGWGAVRPFGPAAGKTCPAPPEPGSREHLAQLDRVRRASTHISANDLAIALKWACSIGSEGPAGQWQGLLESELIRTGDYRTALSALTVAEIALFNAGIACWRTKFQYWYPRPSNLDLTIPLHIHLPNFPSYTSGHSSFSWAVVGSIGEMFPELKPSLSQLATEASWSRVLAGVHYPCDCDGGQATGLAVGSEAARVLQDMAGIVSLAEKELPVTARITSPPAMG